MKKTKISKKIILKITMSMTHDVSYYLLHVNSNVTGTGVGGIWQQ